MSHESADEAIVQLASFANSISAHLAKNQLEAAAIPCFLSNENRPYGPISGGVRLHVRQQDVAAAQEVLHASQVSMQALPTTDDEAATPTARCPRCHHTDIVCRQLPEPNDTLLTKLRLWILAPEKPQCHCFHCGLDFEG
ncbi:DUF2007 domain-containing protein [Hymenobacter sp. BT186]|uniref:DUF2007 domain-containing protein n=1 Tax=Hymenobacter telluris TaxID=2816474 RepID=A0A939EZ24_9BACT|nr:DUF2007 domain-containing protein [Hymenobacter telluris]MBO0359792.1 DUF2007 domain-containing protein [Hymenobacter telluris]MBW3375819.1 DUF2007 domain-containing protein [Hymenobacter norwichensis]